ncbi:MAG: hypothetical protein RL757_1954 [Bacteroidota bacterium]
MSVISLEGMRFFAPHGYYQEEQTIGTTFLIDVIIDTDFNKAAAKDDLAQTVNYELVYQICKTVMKGERQISPDGKVTYKPYKLIETIGNRIIKGLKKQFSVLGEVKVRVRKLNPPLGGIVDASMIETGEKLAKTCAKCNGILLCYGDDTCWCMGEELKIYTRTYEFLKDQFKGCLCKKCLTPYEM